MYWVSQVSQIIFWTGNQKQTIRSVQGLQHSITRKTKNLNVLTAVYRSRNVQVCQQACRKGIILIKLSPPPIIGQPGGKSFPFSASVDTEQAVCKKLFADSWLWALAGVLFNVYIVRIVIIDIITTKIRFNYSSTYDCVQDPREALIVALKREVSILQQENNHLRWKNKSYVEKQI